jgi:hypothetical protein
MTDAAYWINSLELSPHPEGGYFRQTYRAAEAIPQTALPVRFGGTRVFSTAIYYLLAGEQVSRLHRIKSDEVWHFYTGSSLIIYTLDEQGKRQDLRLGATAEKGDAFQHMVPAGLWFGAALEDPSSFALVGCTVAPGFEFADFELAERSALLSDFPAHQELIYKLLPDL